MMQGAGQKLPLTVKKAVKSAFWQCQFLTNRFRALPDFLIVGAQKAGTTSLFDYLRQHPRISPSLTKEVHFFDGGLQPGVDTYERGLAWYRAHFPMAGSRREDLRIFEATPLYLFNPLVPRRIHDLRQDMRIIAILRDPVDRAISHYFHSRRHGAEPLAIMEALQQEESRLAPAMQRQDYKDLAFIHFSYKRRGRYLEQIERYLEVFDRSQLLVLSAEALLRDPGPQLREVFDFLRIDRDVGIGDLRPRHVGGDRKDLDPAVYEYLDDYFQPHNQSLYASLGRDFGWGGARRPRP